MPGIETQSEARATSIGSIFDSIAIIESDIISMSFNFNDFSKVAFIYRSYSARQEFEKEKKETKNGQNFLYQS